MPVRTPAVTAPGVARRAEPLLSPGAKGPAVKRLQQLLTTLGKPVGTIDGDFGTNTRKAVVEFQREAKLPPTGRVDDRTWTALRAAVTRKQEARFLAPARATAQGLDGVRRQVDAFTADGKVTSTEKRALLERVATVRERAESLVSSQSTPALEALARVELLTKTGKLTSKAQSAVAALREGRAGMLASAKAAAHGSPFKPGWARPLPGIATRDLSVGGHRAHVVAIDLADPRVKLQTNSEASRGQTVESFARSSKAEVAINGDFFSFGTHKPSGLAITNGKQWAGTQRGFEGNIAFNGQHAEVMKPNAKNPLWSENVVSGRPTVLTDGKLVLSDPNKNERAARTGLGLSKNGRVLYLVAVEGRSGSGLTATELGKFMRSLGADDGLALDAGGSAQLFVKGRGMVQRSTDPGGARAIANVLMVQAG